MSTEVGVELFVYGSLKRGFHHHDQLRDAEFRGPAETAPGHQLVLQGDQRKRLPAILANRGVKKVTVG